MNTKLLGATLLVSGTTIGAGALALPVVTGAAGFFPSLILLVLTWGYMLYTAFLMLEATLWYPENTNLVTMSRKALGPIGQAVTWIVYLFLLYALTTAYMAGCNPLFLDLFEWIYGTRPNDWVGYLPLLLVFGFCVYHSTHWVDQMNRQMMVGMLITFLVLFGALVFKLDTNLLKHAEWNKIPLALSLVVTSFGFHIIIPSLATYLQRDIHLLKKAIFYGSIIPLGAYIIWEMLSLGTVSPFGWNNALINNISSSEVLIGTDPQPLLQLALRLFTFFLIITSFLGVSLSLFDFLSDGLHIPKNRLGRGTLYVLTFGPPLAISLNNPHIFITALEYAGAFGVVIILAIIPALIALFGRKKRHLSAYQVKGGNWALFAVILISLSVLVHEIIAIQN